MKFPLIMLRREHLSRSNSPHFAVKFGSTDLEYFYNGSLRNSLGDIFPTKRYKCYARAKQY